MSAARSRLAGGHRLVFGTALRCAMLGPVLLDDVPWYPVLAELGLDHPHASGGMAIALLAPPACEGCVVEVPDLAKPLDDLIDHWLRRPGAAQAALGLQTRPGARPEVPHRDLHRSSRVGRLGSRPPATR